MKKIIYILIIVFLGYFNTAISQEMMLKNFPQEKIFIHQNTSFILSGEFLYYKVYCINTNTNNLSEISKIGYVELVSSEKKIIFKHKIKLENGIGYGDFFIPSNVQSGNYKLIAYTQWMKNGENFNYYQSDLDIINPFIENQQDIFVSDEAIVASRVYEFNKTNSNNLESLNTDKIVSGIKSSTKKYKSRERVELTLDALKNIQSDGNISVSVRKINGFNKFEKATSITYESKLVKDKIFKTSLILPELRGELLVGKVINNSNAPVSNVKVTFSISRGDNIFKIGATNSQGYFYFHLTENYNGQEAILNIIGRNDNDLKISIEESKSFDYEVDSFKEIKISPQLKSAILQQSIANQIENSYRDLRPNTITEKELITPFYDVAAKEYVLDEYTRFPTFKETIVEILDLVYLKQNNGERSIQVVKTSDNYKTGMPPLILIDGRIVQDHQMLLDFQTKKVKKISVDQENRYYSTQLFDGIISIETFDGNIENEDFFNSQDIKIKLIEPLNKSVYYKQVYDGNEKWDRLPDYRSQLLWEPSLKVSNIKKGLEFFTSDIIGNFEICIEGFTNTGKPISIKEIISVE